MLYARIIGGKKLDTNCRVGYLVIGWALPACNRRENLDKNCSLEYLVVVWDLRPCDRRENLNRKCSVA